MSIVGNKINLKINIVQNTFFDLFLNNELIGNITNNDACIVINACERIHSKIVYSFKLFPLDDPDDELDDEWDE